MNKRIVVLVLAALVALATLTPVLAEAEKPYAGTTLTVCNWYDYIDEAVIGMFEEETGISINYVNFTTNEELYTKLEAGAGNYDVIFPSDYIIERLIKDDMLEELNYENIPNAQGLLDWIKNPDYDPDSVHSLAYMWGTVGILYNTTMVDDPVDSWGILFDKKYAGQVLMMNSIRDTMGVALKYLGYSMNTDDPKALEEAAALLIQQKKDGIVDGYFVDETKDKMVAGEAALAVMWSGDAMYAMEKNDDLAYAVPMEGSNVWIDGMCIPKGSQNKEAAECFINFLCREDIARMNMDYIWYSTPVQAVVDGMSEEEFNDATLNPPQEVIDRCEYFLDVSDYYDIYEENWMQVRIAR